MLIGILYVVLCKHKFSIFGPRLPIPDLRIRFQGGFFPQKPNLKSIFQGFRRQGPTIKKSDIRIFISESPFYKVRSSCKRKSWLLTWFSFDIPCFFCVSYALPLFFLLGQDVFFSTNHGVWSKSFFDNCSLIDLQRQSPQKHSNNLKNLYESLKHRSIALYCLIKYCPACYI